MIVAVLLNAVSLYIHFTTPFLTSTYYASLSALTWLFGIIFFGAAVYALPRPYKTHKNKTEALTRAQKILFISLVFLGLILRLYKLNHFAIYLDEWHWIHEVKNILLGTVKTPFGFIGDMPSNMPAYIHVFFYLITRNIHLTLRLPGVLYSIGTVCFIFLFVREAYNKKAALFSTLLVTTSIWDIHISQQAWPAVNLAPFLISGALYFLYKTIKYTSVRDALLCGVFLGISINLLYISALSAVVVTVFLLCRLLFMPRKIKFLTPFFILYTATFLTMSPTIAKVIRYPELSIARHRQFFQQNVEYARNTTPVGYYLNQIKVTLLNVNYKADKYSTDPMWGVTVEPVVITLSVLGGLYLLVTLRNIASSMVLLNYIVMLIPLVVLFRFTSVWREYATLPAIYIAAALGAHGGLHTAVFVAKTINKKWKNVETLGFVVLIIVYLIQWGYYWHLYYVRVLKKEPVVYETLCKKTAQYIQKNVLQKKLLLLPQPVIPHPYHLCSILLPHLLADYYPYKLYVATGDIPSKKPHILVVFTKDKYGERTQYERIDNFIKSSNNSYVTSIIKIKGAPHLPESIVYYTN